MLSVYKTRNIWKKRKEENALSDYLTYYLFMQWSQYFEMVIHAERGLNWSTN